MKNLTRLFALMLALLMVFAIAGCGSSTTYESYYEEDGAQNDETNDTNDTNDTNSDTTSDGANNNNNSGGGNSQGGSNNTTSKPTTNVKPGIQAGQVGDKIDASKWGIATSDKGIEDKVNLKGKTIRMLCFKTTNYTSAAFQRTIKAFEKEYGCKVKIDYAAFGTEYQTTLRNAIAAKEPYDVAYMHASWSLDTIASNLYEPLNGSMTTADLLDKNNKGIDLSKSIEISWDGNIYGVCGYRGVNPMIAFYNKVMFERDFDEADDPRTLYENGKWTWDKFIELGSKVTDKANDKWFASWNFRKAEMVASFGGNPVTIKNGVPTVTIESKEYNAGLKNLAKMCYGTTQVVMPQNTEDQLEAFLAGKFYMYTEESDRYIKIMDKIATCNAFKKSGANLGIVPLPLGDTNKDKAYPTGWIETTVCPKGANPDVLIAWAKFWTTYTDPVTTDKTKMNKKDQAMIDKLLAKINPRRCSYSDSSYAFNSLEWNMVTDVARGKDISATTAEYKPQMQSCIDATMSALKKLK